MSKVREAVEWIYKYKKQMCTRNEFSLSLNVRQAPLSLMFTASTVLLNFKTIFQNGGHIGAYFGCTCPNFRTYP